MVHKMQTACTFRAMCGIVRPRRWCLPVNGEREGYLVSKVIERTEARYDVQEVPFGKVYAWRPESVLIECECGKKAALTASTTTCEECGAEHAGRVREASSEHRLGDEALRPWRYSEDHGDDRPALPY